MLKIAVSGKAGSGKNTVASVIVKDILQLNSEEYRIAAFADKIKELTTSFFPGCDQDALYGASELRQKQIESEINEIIPTVATYRQVTLDIGKLGRTYSPSFWVGHAALKYLYSPPNLKAYMIADLRFIEEYKWLKANDFTLIRVKRNNLIQINDVSETEQDKLSDDMFHSVIQNNGSMEDLQNTIKTELDRLFSNNMTYLQVRDAVR
jgi:cytidylate kinase